MGHLRRAYLGTMSEVAWRLPGWPQRLLTEFSLAERGSMVDMLAAAQATPRREMRRKYFLHALDEGRHAGIFAERVKALSGGRVARSDAVIEDAGLLQDHGIVGGKTLFERLGELEFLAFVFVAEADAVEQFGVYLDRKLPDPETTAALRDILKDESFHVSYSKLECERYRREGKPVDAALRAVRWRRMKEGWMRFTRDFGEWASGFWLLLLYFGAVGPFRLIARLESGGWRSASGASAVARNGLDEALAAARLES
ncbi:MAG: ferritin-like domain-containing protein [Myxococcales bacterium]|nr:ferritin-like domain-containing protein [Myxococcales bacterium]